MATGKIKASAPSPNSCIIRSAATAPGQPTQLRTGASVAWLSDGSATDQLASVSATTPSRLRSIIDMVALASAFYAFGFARHCEEPEGRRSNQDQKYCLDCFAALAMTKLSCPTPAP